MSSPEAAIEATITQFSRHLGSQLEAAYLFGSFVQGYYQPGESDINMLMIVEDGVDVFDIRTFYLPLWDRFGDVLGRPPLVVSASAFERYKRLVPMQTVAQNGRLLTGSSAPLQNLPQFDPHEVAARDLTEALTASNALMPMIMTPEKAAQRHAQLRRLARRLWQTPIPEGETAVQTYARVQQKLGPQIARLPAARLYNNRNVPPVTAPFLPGLQTLYRKADNIVMVLANLSPQDITRTNWTQMADRLAAECGGLILTTAAQLSISLVYDIPIELKTRAYQYNWGMDHLAKLQTSRRQIMRHAGTAPTHIALDELPHALLTMHDDQLHTIIHDFQNKLLNIQLTHELLHRFGDTEKFTPPEPLPDRNLPSRKRITGIINHLNWWSEFYTDQMRQAAQE